MNWEAVGALAELVGAAGVIATLAYLGVQIRQNTRHLEQNTRSVRSSTTLSAANAIGEWAAMFADNEALAGIYTSGLRGDPLDHVERARFDGLVTRLLVTYEYLYYQHRDSLVEPELWESRAQNLAAFMRQPGARISWERHGVVYAESFKTYVDGLLADQSTPKKETTT